MAYSGDRIQREAMHMLPAFLAVSELDQSRQLRDVADFVGRTIGVTDAQTQHHARVIAYAAGYIVDGWVDMDNPTARGYVEQPEYTTLEGDVVTQADLRGRMQMQIALDAPIRARRQ